MKYIIGLLLILVAIKLYATTIKNNVNEELSLGEAINGSKSYFYNKDKTKIIYSYMGHTFLLGKNELDHVDLESFTPINNEYAYDKNHIYWKVFIIQGVDKDSFMVVGEDYSKDKNSVFFEQNKLKEADAQTFKLGGRFQSEDKNYCYQHGKVEYTKLGKHWSYDYTESINIKIKLLSRNISQSTDDIKVLQNRRELQQLLDKQDVLSRLIEKFDKNKLVLSLFNSLSLEEVIKNLKNNNSMDKSEKYSFLSDIYKFKSIVSSNREDSKQVGYFLKKSIELKPDDKNVYAYAIWLYEQKDNRALVYFKKLLSTKYREKSLIKLSNIAFLEKKIDEALEYFKKVNVSNIMEINTKQNYIKLLEQVVVLNIEKKDFKRAKNNLNNVLAFYQNAASSNPYLFEELANVYKQFGLIYDGLNNQKKKEESFEKSMLIYTSLNKAFPNEFYDEVKQLEALKKELGE